MKNENMEFQNMTLSLNQKKLLHEQLVAILKRKLAVNPDDSFLHKSLYAEETEWAKIEARLNEKKR